MARVTFTPGDLDLLLSYTDPHIEVDGQDFKALRVHLTLVNEDTVHDRPTTPTGLVCIGANYCNARVR